jgi:hypothetical protein
MKVCYWCSYSDFNTYYASAEKPETEQNHCKNRSIMVLAEGVVSEPFLPSGDQGHKGGFATLPKQQPITCRITNEIPAEIKSFFGYFGHKAGRELGDFQELGTWPDKTKQAVLARLKTAIGWVLQDWKDLGDASAVQILDDHGIPEISTDVLGRISGK